jgi:YVTN family beta-propeller protein
MGLIGALAIAMLGRNGTPSTDLALTSASAWFPSPNTGSVALIDGTTVTRTADVPVAAKGDLIETVQSGSGAYVVDHTSGQVWAVDGAMLRASSPIRLGNPGDSFVGVRSNGQVTWTIGTGGTEAQQRVPQSLSPLGSAVPFPGHATAAPILGEDGSLWLIDGGLLRSFRDGMMRTSAELTGVTRSALVMASGRPLVLDLVRHRAIQIDSHSGQPIRETRYDSADPAALVTGSSSGAPRVLAVSPTEGSLLVCDLGAKGCWQISLGEPSSDDRYGQPVAWGPYAYVPDYQAGTVIMVDMGTRVVTARPLVDVSGGHFGLLAYHGYLWFDDTAADKAGVVTRQGGTAVSTSGGESIGAKVTPRHGRQATDQSGPGRATAQGSLPNSSANRASTGSAQTGSSIISRSTAGRATTGTPNRGTPNRVIPNRATPNRATPNSGTPKSGTPGTGSASPAGGGIGSVTLTAAFTWSPIQPAAGNLVDFKDTSTRTPTAWQWTFDNGTSQPGTSTSQNPTYRWANPGTYQVTLVVTRSGTTATSVRNQITVVPAKPPGTLNITPTTLPQGTVGLLYDATLKPNGGAGPFTWTMTNNPSWLQGKANPDGTFALSGTPTKNDAGTTPVLTVQVSNGRDVPGQQSYSFAITVVTVDPTSLTLGGRPLGAAVDPTTGTVYVAVRSSNQVSVIDGATHTVTATILVGSNPWGVAVDPSTHTVYVANHDSNSVSVIDGNTDTVSTTIPVGTTPTNVGVDPTTDTVYVTNNGSANVSVINGKTDTVSTTIAVGSSPIGAGVDPTTDTVYVTNNGSASVSVVNGKTDTVSTTIAVGIHPFGVGVDYTTHTVYVSEGDFADGFSSENVAVIDGTTNTVSTTIPVGATPANIGVDVATHTVYVANFDGVSDTVSVIDGLTSTVATTLQVGTNPWGVAVDPSTHAVYVANNASSNVSVIHGSTRTLA